MNEEFEKFLSKQPPRGVPPEWRAQILESARARVRGEAETRVPWWRLLPWPSPVAWAGVGCAWVLIIGMNFAARSPAEETTSAPAAIPAGDFMALIAPERELVIELSQPEQQPAEPPRQRPQPGACNERREPDAVETA